MKQEAWEMVQAPVHGPGPDFGPECAVCGWGDGQDGYGLPHSLHTCVHILKVHALQAWDDVGESYQDRRIAQAARALVAALDDPPQRWLEITVGADEDDPVNEALSRLIAAVEGK